MTTKEAECTSHASRRHLRAGSVWGSNGARIMLSTHTLLNTPALNHLTGSMKAKEYESSDFEVLARMTTPYPAHTHEATVTKILLAPRKRGPLALHAEKRMKGNIKRINGHGRTMINCTHLSCSMLVKGNPEPARPHHQSIPDAIAVGASVGCEDTKQSNGAVQKQTSMYSVRLDAIAELCFKD
jgi:hypothetical protein